MCSRTIFAFTRANRNERTPTEVGALWTLEFWIHELDYSELVAGYRHHHLVDCRNDATFCHRMSVCHIRSRSENGLVRWTSWPFLRSARRIGSGLHEGAGEPVARRDPADDALRESPFRFFTESGGAPFLKTLTSPNLVWGPVNNDSLN